MSTSYPPITLHLGAHRTATTRLQKTLDNNAGLLTAEGVAALTPPYAGKRNKLTIRSVHRMSRRALNSRFLPKRLYFRNRANQTLKALIPQTTRRIIISDENMLGPIFDRVTGRGLYPDAAEHLQAVRKLLGSDICEIHLTLRSYEQFIVSAYAMSALYAGNLPPFEKIRDRLLSIEQSWVEIIETIHAVFDQTPLHIWRFDQLDLQHQLSELLGKPLAKQLRYDNRSVINSAPTGEAIEYALSNKRTNSFDPDSVLKRFASGRPFSPLTKEELERLGQNFLSDLKTIDELTHTHSANIKIHKLPDRC
jgi:hypothetical protein